MRTNRGKTSLIRLPVKSVTQYVIREQFVRSISIPSLPSSVAFVLRGPVRMGLRLIQELADVIRETFFHDRFHLRTVLEQVWLTVKMKSGLKSLFVATLLTSSVTHAQCPSFTSYSKVRPSTVIVQSRISYLESLVDRARYTIDWSPGLAIYATTSCVSYFLQFLC